MKSENKQPGAKLSLKDRITIFIKKTKPMSFPVGMAIVTVLFVCLVVIARFDSVSGNSAPSELTADNNKMRITITGDVNIDHMMRKQANKSSYEDLFRGVSTYWESSDYVVANINAPILKYDVENYKSTREKGEESYYLRPAALRGLVAAGINLFSFANDDVYNYGRTGIASTLNLMSENNVEYIGIANNDAEVISKSMNYFYWTENGDAVESEVTLFSVNDEIRKYSTVTAEKVGIVNSSIDAIYEQINIASQESGQVIVYVHFGDNDSGIISDAQRQMAYALIDSGADLVIGSHPHMLQPVEKYGDGIIVYGLGDLTSSDNFSLMLDGALADYVISDNGEVNLYLTPVRLVDGCPTITSSKMYKNRIQNILTDNLKKEDYMITEDGLVCISLGQLK